MLYKQLQRINEIDQQIHDMHSRLAEYYRERATLLNEKTAIAPITSTVDPKQLYDKIVADWQPYGLKLPTYTALSKRLTKAAGTIDALLADNPQLNGNLKLIAVPPQAQLDKLIAADERRHRYLSTEDYQSNKTKRATGWSFVIVTSADFSLPIDSLSDNLGAEELHYKQYDCRALGVREVIAADLLGLEVVTDNNWTLLLHDATSAHYIPCATKQGDHVIFDIDDASCLLGNNYVQPAIAVT